MLSDQLPDLCIGSTDEWEIPSAQPQKHQTYTSSVVIEISDDESPLDNSERIVVNVDSESGDQDNRIVIDVDNDTTHKADGNVVDVDNDNDETISIDVETFDDPFGEHANHLK